eukprot:scaffold12212_cov86-Skeletonema_marinoi.AAC.5
MSIVASVCIQTMSLHDSTASFHNVDDRQETKSLRVNLSGVEIQPSAHVKLLHLDARRIKNQIGDLLEECIFWRGDILVTVTNFPDEISSAGFASELVESIYRVFRWMHNCFNIIINCRNGRNRCVSFAARLASLIQDGINEPSEGAYHFYQQICQSVCEEYEARDHNTWPHLCTNLFAQSVINLFPRRGGVLRYPGCQGFHVENPHGSLRCNYEYDPEQLEDDIILERHLHQWNANTLNLVRERLEECRPRLQNGGDSVILLLDQLQPRTQEVSEDFNLQLQQLDNGYLLSIVCSSHADGHEILTNFRVREGYPRVQLRIQTSLFEEDVYRLQDTHTPQWETLNALRDVTRLDSTRDIAAFNTLCEFVMNPNTHWISVNDHEDLIHGRMNYDGW